MKSMVLSTHNCSWTLGIVMTAAAYSVMALVCSAAVAVPMEADWPLWRFDAGRTAASPHDLPEHLVLQWTRELPAPKRAWPQQQDDGDKLAFDRSYEPVAHMGLLFVPSMVRDSVTAYGLRDGEEQWRFYTDGPVRFAPAAHNGKLYVVSDDGCLYCLDARTGALLWTHRGGPSEQRILGNGRLIASWPARGGPVLQDGVVYYAAGVWSFMGVFIHALDAETGAALWTNSSSGAAFLDQPHAGGSFAGAAPQGYLVAADDVLLVPNGRARPAGYELDTGAFLYLNLSSRLFGRGWGGQGGYAVMAKGGYFHVTGEIGRVSDGELISQVRTPRLAGTIVQPARELELERWPLIDTAVAGPNGLVGIAAGKLTGHAHKPMDEIRESEACRRGRTAPYRPLRELWSAAPDAHVERLFIQAGNRFYGSGVDGEVLAVDLPGDDGTARVSSVGVVEGSIWNMLAAHGRLVVTTEEGQLYCFGAESRDATTYPLEQRPAPSADLPHGGIWAERVAAMLAHTEAAPGFAVVAGIGSGALLQELLRQSELDIIALDPDARKVSSLRRALDAAGLYGQRVAVHTGDLASVSLPRYLARIIATEDNQAAGLDAGNIFVENVFDSLRPYGGAAWLPLLDGESRERVAAWARAAGLANMLLEQVNGMTRLARVGALPGAGAWTHQNANAANTVVSRDTLRAPLGLLWFGGPSNENVLPRHGRGPIPQVAGGRLFILGPDTLGARDVYTGRLLWEKGLPGIGTPYDTTSHQPGADHVGSPYTSHEDSVYVIHDHACLRLDSSTGKRMATFTAPAADAEKDAAQWGFVSVWEELLIAGVDAQYFDASRPGGNRSWNATSSARLMVMDRRTGAVHWSRQAQFGFRHNAIAAGNGRLYVMDRLSDGALGLLERRGQLPEEPELLALDIHTGDVIWRESNALFGSWLGYAEKHDLLLQAGRPANNSRQILEDEPYPAERLTAYNAATGETVWRRAVQYENAPMLHDDMIIVHGRIIDLLTGADKQRPHPLTDEAIPWRYPASTNCAQIIASKNLVTFRRGVASYFDLALDSGVASLGGFRAGCTPNLVPADGVLSAPDYTRTCICAYPLQSALALVHAPELEGWTTYATALPRSDKRVRRVGVNFGAPGDRRSSAGTLWLAYPAIGSLGGQSEDRPLFSGGRGGTSPELLPLSITPEHPGWHRFQRHRLMAGNDEMNWVFASGISGAATISVIVAPEEADHAAYTVRLFFAEPDGLAPGQRIFSVYLQDTMVLQDFDIAAAAKASKPGITRSFSGVIVKDTLEIEMAAADPAYPAVLNGIEIIAE